MMKSLCSSIVNHRTLLAGAAALVALALLLPGCGKKEEESAAGDAGVAAAVHPAAPGATIFLAEAQFIREKGDDGKTRSVPGPARLAGV